MQITDDLVLDVVNTTEYAINVQAGSLVVHLDTDGAASDLLVEIPSKLIVPMDTTVSFTLGGDIATITRL